MAPVPTEGPPGGVPRVLGIVEGDPRTAFSGIPWFLLSALAHEMTVAGCIDVAPDGLTKLALAGATFHPRKEMWRGRFHTSPVAHRVLSRKLAAALSTFDRPFDLALQIGSWCRGQPRPYALYVDQTRLMAERGWPEWLPLPDRERSNILRLERQMYAGAAHILVMGASARDSLTDDYEIDGKRITVAGGGLNFETMPIARGPAPEPVIMFVGRDFRRKGGDCLLRAFRRVREELPSAVLYLVGASPDVRQPGVTSLGKVHSRQDLAARYSQARVFAMPSRYEPWGLAFVEAMAHGLPCVGTAIGSIPEILGHGEAGLLVPPNDEEALAEALLRLLRDDDLARRLGRTGRARVEDRLTWAHVAARAAPALTAALQAGG